MPPAYPKQFGRRFTVVDELAKSPPASPRTLNPFQRYFSLAIWSRPATETLEPQRAPRYKKPSRDLSNPMQF